jgi:hypothetical protein
MGRAALRAGQRVYIDIGNGKQARGLTKIPQVVNLQWAFGGAV